MRRLLLLALLVPPAAAGPLTAGRAGEAREKLLRARGGSRATENAVARALAWLANHQGRDGAWDADGFSGVHDCDCDGPGGGWHGDPVPSPFDREVTALATLAFLGAGQSHVAGEHRETVARALARLRRAPGRATLFAVAYTTQALAEAYDLTGDGELKEPVERGLAILAGSRLPDGGWRYYAGSRWASGVPTTTAVVCALRAAEEAGFAVAGDYREPVEKLFGRLTNRKTGRLAYTLDGHKMGYTPTTTNAASSLLVRSWLGQGVRQPFVAMSLRAVGKRKPRWSLRFKTMKVNGVERKVQIGTLQHYYWWHATEALARLKAPGWTAWNKALKKALLPKQRKRGHAAGSWDPAGTYGKVGGRVFSTALCTMMLESYYRYP